ncbi:MAG: hypothetical protein IBJ11_08705, partial [Phycisphaerales bacterium]|nr:hypothetical protein [Phycisphaerales bacterium]
MVRRLMAPVIGLFASAGACADDGDGGLHHLEKPRTIELFVDARELPRNIVRSEMTIRLSPAMRRAATEEELARRAGDRGRAPIGDGRPAGQPETADGRGGGGEGGGGGGGGGGG